MSLYGETCKIGGVVCGIVMRGAKNGEYQVVIEREYASLEEIEAIDWALPQVEGETVLPVGYGYTVTDILYSNAIRSYTVVLQVADQYLGDVTGYQSQVTELRQAVAGLEDTVTQKEQQLAEKDAALAEKTAAVAALEAAGTAAQVEEQLGAAYAEGVESNG